MDPKEPIITSLIFGFGHRARHGKDTVAKIIKGDRDMFYDIRIYCFAYALKNEVNQAALSAGGMHYLWKEETYFVNGRDEFVQLPDWVTYDPNPPMDDPLCPLGKQRTLLQWWGGEFRRSVDPDYWVKQVKKQIAKEKPEIALITDVRYPNEIKFVEEYGESIKVHNPRIPILPNGHQSEEALANYDGWTATIHNEGTLQDLKRDTLFLFDELMNDFPVMDAPNLV